ncbi:MAG: acyltransferase domain-containing protein [Leptolyngbya sp. SIO1E4]|nr:acyltransferase domain-containing protein [Leptolyngbya sp. SIO1E4]
MHQTEELDYTDSVAIIGLAGRFPRAQNLEEFWQNLRDGVESVDFFSDQELEAAGIDPALLNNPNYVKAGISLEDKELFDANFFGYSPKQAEIIDPQQRLFLECAWNALESAGYDPQTYQGRISVYGGAGINSYLFFNLASNPELLQSVGLPQLRHSNRQDNLATRIAYKLNLKGSAFTVQSGCSTSLVAVHLACQSLLDHECNMALAGGVRIDSLAKTGYLYQEGGIASPDGHCRTFDAKAKGTLGGEGVGIVLLKRLEDAIADGDTLHAVIKGSAINNDGADKVGYTAPSVNGQAAVIAEALAVGQSEAETISYVEAHGTGTVLGDPIEIAALTEAFHATTGKKGFCAIGSVKTNIGHLDTAAGIAGLIKTVLALKSKQIPPSLHFATPNPAIDFANSPFYVNAALSQWQTNDIPRRAGVSSFGIGGTNAHAILEEAPVIEPSSPSRSWQLLVLSAKTSSALETATANLVRHCRQHPDLNPADAAYTLQMGRQVFDYRRMVVVQDLKDAVEVLETLDPQRVFSHCPQPVNRQVVFMFPGQGTQYVNMGRELYQTEPLFQKQVDHCCALLESHLDVDLRTILYPKAEQVEAAAQQLQQTCLTQPALFVVEYALARLWMAWGIKPQAMIGHSVGEYVAACLADVFCLEDALALVAARGRLMQQLPPGAMLAVPLSQSELVPLLSQKTGKTLALAANNTPKSCVVSGPTEAIDVFQESLTQQGLECRRLHTSHAFHSQMMDAILEPFVEQVSQVRLHPPKVPFVSNLTSTWITAAEAADPHYWAMHLRQTVRFSEGMAELLQAPERIFLEVGPGRTLSTLTRKQQGVEQSVVCSLRHPQDQASDVMFLLKTLGRLWLEGIPVDWSGFYTPERRYRIPLPTYPFERKRYWIEPAHRIFGAAAPVEPNFSESEIKEHSLVVSAEAVSTATALTADPSSWGQNYVAPRNDIEQKIAGIWQAVLGLQQVSVYDNFFEVGGDSVVSVQVVALAHQEGLKLAPRQLFESPTVAELATVAQIVSPLQAEQGLVTGPIPLTPMQHWFLEQNLAGSHRWHPTILLEVQQVLEPALLEEALQQLWRHHDALRLNFRQKDSGWQQINTAPEVSLPLVHLDVAGLSADTEALAIEAMAAKLHASLNLVAGPLVSVAFLDGGTEGWTRLLWVVHSLVIDSISWRILLEDLQLAYQQLSQGRAVQLRPKTTSFKHWSECLQTYAKSAQVTSELEYWLALSRQAFADLAVDYPAGVNSEESVCTVSIVLTAQETQALLHEIPQIYKAETEEALLTALVQTLTNGAEGQSLLVDLEKTGRSGINYADVDLSRTIGQFTTLFPVRLAIKPGASLGEALKIVKEQLRNVPNQGLGYGVLRYLHGKKDITEQLQGLQPEVSFAYLDERAQTLPEPAPASQLTAGETSQTQHFSMKSIQRNDATISSSLATRPYLLEIIGYITGEQLHVNWRYSTNLYRSSTIQDWSEQFVVILRSFISASQTPDTDIYTPSDFGAAQMSQKDLSKLLSQIHKSR